MQDRSVATTTWAVIGGRPAQTPGTPLNVPPILASTFLLGADRGYSRDDGTATWEAFEELLGGLELGVAVAFASGMAAVTAIFDLLPPRGEITLPEECFYAVAGLATAGHEQGRWSVTRLAVDDTPGWLAATARADLLWLESPTNPLLAVADLPTILAAPRKRGALAVVDNTFATPIGQQPLELGADLVVHSATKYLGGHSDLLLGAAVANSGDLAQRLRDRRQLTGATPGALETYLALRGARTLPLRFERATSTAGEIAERLLHQPDVSVVRYPGLPCHATHDVARGFMHGFGAVISFDVEGGARRADAVCQSLEIIRHATSLGAVESTIERRAAIPGERHLPPSLLRLSIGCEDPNDLWADLDGALLATRDQASCETRV